MPSNHAFDAGVFLIHQSLVCTRSHRRTYHSKKGMAIKKGSRIGMVQQEETDDMLVTGSTKGGHQSQEARFKGSIIRSDFSYLITPEAAQVDVSIAVATSFENVAVDLGIGVCLSRLGPTFAS